MEPDELFVVFAESASPLSGQRVTLIGFVNATGRLVKYQNYGPPICYGCPLARLGLSEGGCVHIPGQPLRMADGYPLNPRAACAKLTKGKSVSVNYGGDVVSLQ